VARIIAAIPSTWTFLSLYSLALRKAIDAGPEVPALLLSRAEKEVMPAFRQAKIAAAAD
jgi:hypothetical protein